MNIESQSHILMLILSNLFFTSSKPHPAKHLKDMLPVPGGNYRPGMLTDVIDRFVHDDEKDKISKEFASKGIILKDSTYNTSDKPNIFHGVEMVLPARKNNSVNHANNGSGGEWIKINTSAHVEGSAWVDDRQTLHLLKVNLKLNLN